VNRLQLKQFHARIVEIEVLDGSTAQRMDVLADTGSEISVQQAAALKESIQLRGLQEDTQPKVTADNEPFRTEGITTQQFKFAGDNTVFTHEVCVVDKAGIMPILGNDFWGKHNAVMDFGTNQVTIDRPGCDMDGAVRLTIPLRTHAGQSKVAAAIRPKELVVAVCRAMDSFVVQPGECIETVVPMAVDMEL